MTKNVGGTFISGPGLLVRLCESVIRAENKFDGPPTTLLGICSVFLTGCKLTNEILLSSLRDVAPLL